MSNKSFINQANTVLQTQFEETQNPTQNIASFNEKRSKPMFLKKTKKRIRKRSDKINDNRFLIRRKNDSLVVEATDLAAVLEAEIAEKTEKKHPFVSRNSDFNTQENINELNKINAKIIKVTNYWTGLSQLIPNTFRITCFLEDDLKYLLEYQDLSKKEVLAQFYSKHSGSFEADNFSENKDVLSGLAKKDSLVSRKSAPIIKQTFNCD